MWIERSHQAEILDGTDFTREELFQNLRELALVNRWLGGHQNSIRLLDLCLGSGFKPDVIADIGCGGGDTLEILQTKFSESLPKTMWLGCDLNPDCIEYSKTRHPGNGIEYLNVDFREIRFPDGELVLFHASLFFHHFMEEEILEFLSFVRASGAGLIINDLHRHPLALQAIKMISAVPGVGRLFRNDAPLSVKRGFLKSEWIALLNAAGIKDFRIQWVWAFRHNIYIPPQSFHEAH
jgi:SAM-dependent methyltransferase